MPAPAPGTVVDGYRFKGGDPNQQSNWERSAPATGPAAAGFEDLGDGWYRSSDGATYQRGRGGAFVQRTPATGVATDGQSPAGLKLTEDQGKAQTYARLQADAERAYRQARRDGYQPGNLNNAAASFFEGIPGLDGLAPIIRSDVADRGRQAEMQWTDAQLKAVSGAASPEAEVRRNVKTYFPTFGQNIDDIEPRMAQGREVAGQAARIRAGQGARDIKPPLPLALESRYQQMFDRGQINRNAPLGSRTNPLVYRTEPELKAFLAKPENIGRWVMGLDGRMLQASGPRRTNRPAPRQQPAPSRQRPASGYRVVSVED